MMLLALRVAIAAVLVLTLSGLAAAQSLPGSTTAPTSTSVQSLPAGRSVWTSEDGSTVEITVDTTGTLTGTFTPGFACGSPSTATAETTRPIGGTVMVNAVVWNVSFPNCASVGTWIGHYRTVGTEEQLATLWTLALPESPPGVGSTYTGSEVFIRQPQ